MEKKILSGKVVRAIAAVLAAGCLATESAATFAAESSTSTQQEYRGGHGRGQEHRGNHEWGQQGNCQENDSNCQNENRRPPEPPRDENGNFLPPPDCDGDCQAPPTDENGKPLPPPGFNGETAPEPPKDAEGNPLPPPPEFGQRNPQGESQNK